jgi:hypothetical protein
VRYFTFNVYNLLEPLDSTGDADIRYVKGIIDKLGLWSISRTQAEIQNNMTTLLNGDEAGLAAYFNFDAGEGLTITNLVGNQSIPPGAFSIHDKRDPSWILADQPEER